MIETIQSYCRSAEGTAAFNCIVFGAIALMIAVLVAPLVFNGLKEFRKQGIFFCLIGAGFLWSMATKPVTPSVTWETGIHDDHSTFDTNTWATVHFKWTKDAMIVGTEPLYFATKARDAGADIMPVEIGESTCGALSWDYTFTGGENATNYLYYAYTTGSVHTNGTWTGNILIKRMPNGDIDQMVIIRARLMNNGKEIAPLKE